MAISISNPLPPPPTPQQVLDAANDAINDLTGGGGDGGSSSDGGHPGFPASTKGGGNAAAIPGVNVMVIPAPPAPFAPAPFPVAFSDAVSHAAEIVADDTSSAAGDAKDYVMNVFGKPRPRDQDGGTSAIDYELSTVTKKLTLRKPRKLPSGPLQSAAHPLSLAVQAIAIALHGGAKRDRNLLPAIVTFIAVVPGSLGSKSPRTGAAVSKAIATMLDHFSEAVQDKARRLHIHALGVAFQSALLPGLFRAEELSRLPAPEPEHAARRHLIAVLHHSRKYG